MAVLVAVVVVVVVAVVVVVVVVAVIAIVVFFLFLFLASATATEAVVCDSAPLQIKNKGAPRLGCDACASYKRCTTYVATARPS